MAEYIEKEALKNKLRAYNCTSTSDNVDYNRGLNDALRYVVPMIIAGQPTEDVVPVVHGRWVASGQCNHKPCRIRSTDHWTTYKCSVCGYSNGRRFSTKYCSYCGARMDGE